MVTATAPSFAMSERQFVHHWRLPFDQQPALLHHAFMKDVPPGWRAIDEALAALYGAQRPRHYGTLVPVRAGGTDPLHGISAYFVRAPAPHWHFVSYGLTELFDKESPNPKVSGFGFELTMRIGNAREAVEPEPWTGGLLQSLARYVYATGRYFEPGHFFELPEPVAPGFPAVAFVRDPDLPITTGAFGTFEFLQTVPLHTDELRALKAWNTLGLLDAMAKRDPKWIFTPGRPSALRDPEVARAVAEGSAKDGSGTPRLRVSRIDWRRMSAPSRIELTLPVAAARDLGAVLRGRVPFGRALELLSQDGEVPAVRFEPGGAVSVAPGTPTLSISLTRAAASAAADALSTREGEIRLSEVPGLVIQVRP